MTAISENQFYPLEFDAEVIFYRNDHGEVERVVGVVNGVTYEAKKIL